MQKTTDRRPPRPGQLFEFSGAYPLTKSRATHAFRGFKHNPSVPLSRDFDQDRGVVASLLQQERRKDRKILGDRLFYGKPTHWVEIEAHTLSLPNRRISLLKVPLSLNEPGFDGKGLLKGILEFCVWQGGQVREDILIVNDGSLTISEASVLLQSTAHTKIYWATCLLSKFASLVKQ